MSLIRLQFEIPVLLSERYPPAGYYIGLESLAVGDADGRSPIARRVLNDAFQVDYESLPGRPRLST